MELWDAYYSNSEPAGCDLIRGQEVPDGLYHLVAEAMVQHKDGSFLMMQRDFNKPIKPGKFEVTAGGSVLKGETLLQGVKRELFEETGIECDEFVPLFSEIAEFSHSIFNMFYCITDCPKDSVRLQEGETIAFRWIEFNELSRMMEESGEKIASVKRLARALQCLKEKGLLL